MIQRNPATCEVVAKGERDQEQQPNYPSERSKMQKAAAAFDVHEEECNQDRLAYGDRKRKDEIKWTKINVGSHPSQRQQRQQRDASTKIDFWCDDFFHQRCPTKYKRGNKNTQTISTKCQHKPAISTGL